MKGAADCRSWQERGSIAMAILYMVGLVLATWMCSVVGAWLIARGLRLSLSHTLPVEDWWGS